MTFSPYHSTMLTWLHFLRAEANVPGIREEVSTGLIDWVVDVHES